MMKISGIAIYGKGLISGLLLLVALLLAPTAVAEAPAVNWQFRADSAIWAPSTTDGSATFFGSTHGSLYALHSKNGKQLWRFKAGGAIFSGVAIDGKSLFFTSDDGFLYKLNRRNGKQIWKTGINQHPMVARIMPSPTDCCSWDYRSATPIVQDGIVYVGSGDKTFYAVDSRSGKVKWSYETSGQIRSTAAIRGDKIVFANYGGDVIVLDRKDGHLLWRYATGKPILSSPLIVGESVVIGSRDTNLYAFNLADGSVQWKKPYVNGSWIESSAVAYDRNIYIGSSDWKVALALNPVDGTSIWESRTLDGGNLAPPTVTDAAVYQGILGYNKEYMPEGGLVKLDRQSGKLIWRFDLPEVPGQIGFGVVSAPEVVGDSLLFGTVNGAFYSLTR